MTASDTWVCIASGPSLHLADIALICKAKHEGRVKVIAVKDNYLIAPWADAMYACDVGWWEKHAATVKAVFNGPAYSVNRVCRKYGAKWWRVERVGYNSGVDAIRLVLDEFGAGRVLLTGFDGGHDEDEPLHWFGYHDHVEHDPESLDKWPARFAKLAGHPVINCSRRTRLTCFPRADLAACLNDLRTTP